MNSEIHREDGIGREENRTSEGGWGVRPLGFWTRGIARIKDRLESLTRDIRDGLVQPGPLNPDALEPGRWWNGTLRSADQLVHAAERAMDVGLPLTGDTDYDWDALESLELLLAHCDPDDRITDIGLHEHQPLLDWLEILGFGIVQPEPAVRLRANRTLSSMGSGSSFEDALSAEDGALHRDDDEESYDAVLCRSLSGSRIGIPERIAQARRLLRPGGLFIMSTEFWDMPTPYQDGERRCAKDYFCCRDSLEAVVDLAEAMGMTPVAPVFVGPIPEDRHPGLLGMGVGPAKLAFRMI